MKHPYLKYNNLDEVMQANGGPVNMLRGSNIGPYVFPVVEQEYTNWREEQRAWKNSVALLNLSYHMTSVYLKGPDALRLLKRVGCNKFGDFPINRGKQLILSSHDGYLIADTICFHTSDDVYRISGSPIGPDWIQYNVDTGDYDVELERDETVHFREGDPKLYIYQIQGPFAQDLLKEVADGEMPEIRFFQIGEFKIKGKPVRALRHGMAGVPGFELFGPWADSQVVLEALEAAGEKYAMRKVGARAYPSTCLESGWMALPCPAIYHSQEMKPYREWLGPMHLEVLGSLGGSLMSDDIRDYYMDPVEVGYGKFLDLESDCIGRDALAAKLKTQKRAKVTLVWNQDDVMRVVRASMFDTDNPAKFIDMPLSVFATFQFDQVIKNGKSAGISTYSGMSANANEMLSLALVDIEHAGPGTEVTLLWGESNSRRQTVEQNNIYEIRAKVAPVPYFEKTNKKF